MPTKFAMRLLAGTAVSALLTGVSLAAEAEARPYDIPQQDAATALQAFAMQSGRQVLFPYEAAKGKTAPEVKGDYSDEEVVALLAASAGLKVTADDGRTVTLRPQFTQAAESGSDGTVDTLVVTAQKREEDIQDVPIAISAFTQEDLTRQQIAGGPDLITQVPNMTFTKTNFSSYSVQLRGIGTQAISATTDPAVAVAFNNTPFIRNRFFEQEFYDLQRVEVLRGPQGTLYGRNATAGVVNIISQKPKFIAEAKLSGDVSNYSSSRFEGMLNIPLVEDKVALRLAGAWTKRDGYATNELSGNPIDGRDLWSTRVSLRVSPNDRIDANLIWEHFEEDDDRLRSGKQLCDKHVVTEVAGIPTGYYQGLPETGQSGVLWSGVQASFSQGCERNSLYSPEVFQTVNGLMLPYYVPLGGIGLPIPGGGLGTPDPYVSTVQSRDLRVIESTIDPDYRAKADLGELQISFDITDSLTLTSETAYSNDFVYSLQDFNRFNTAPGAWTNTSSNPAPRAQSVLTPGPNGGIFCDPQLGCSDRLIAVDISTAKSWQFSQELRLASDFGGPFNFSLGANFLRADSEDKYYVFINSISLIAASGPPFNTYEPYVPGETDNVDCLRDGYLQGDPNGVYPVQSCTYIDPNPIGSVNDEGHNYFLSKNPYKLISYAVFGEAYYNLTDNLKITGGLRWTVDKKEAPIIPTWILASYSVGYPVAEVIEREWREPTGRLTVDWKPDLDFTDETLFYTSYAHGYKAGGANPPGFVREFFANPEAAESNTAISLTRPKTFDPEFVDAFELGAKNTLANGLVTLNLAAFYYDYEGYQISEIVDRSAFNRNFDAEVWGAELEADWRPLENLRFGLKGGYENTRIKDGEAAIDLMDRTAGNEDWIVHRPFPTFASSCVVPKWLHIGNHSSTPENPELVNTGGVGGGNPGGCELAYVQGLDPATSAPFVLDPYNVSDSGAIGHFIRESINYPAWNDDLAHYPCWPTDPGTGQPVPLGVIDYPGVDPACLSALSNNGEGFAKQLGGNELPNAPHWTWTITGDYTLPLVGDWLVNLHTDLHWQSQSYWRVFQDSDFSVLDEYFTMNLAAIFTNEDAGWNIMAYIKNVTDETAITGAFLFSDDTGLTTNVFLTEPRLYGLRVTKNWTGGPLWGSFGARHAGPYDVTVELGGQVQRHDAPSGAVLPTFNDAFPAPLDVFEDPQQNDLDWGDGRDVKITWRPGAGPWMISAAYRSGETNGNSSAKAQTQSEPACAFGGFFAFACESADPKYAPYQNVTLPIHSEARIVDREEHTIIDFAVARDVGFGSLSRSTVSAGLRYAELESSTTGIFRGIPDWDFSDGFLIPGTPSTHTRYDGRTEARRQFEGMGPALTWEASYPILGDTEVGNLGVEWSFTGGMLFGRQTTDVSGVDKASYFQQSGFYGGFMIMGIRDSDPPDLVTETPIDISPRSRSLTVPTAAFNLGLSYEVDRFRVGAGYRWERYFDAIDGGIEEASDKDRTIDGPYFKLAVGFGG